MANPLNSHGRQTPACANCGLRPGTLKWYGDGGALALSHGWYAMWCRVCALEAQIAHAEERAAALDGLRTELGSLLNLEHGEVR